jgi:hypothetical protein
MLLASCTARTGGTLQEKDGLTTLTTKDHVVKIIKWTPPVTETYVLLKAGKITELPSMDYLDTRFMVIAQADLDKYNSEPVPRVISGQKRYFIPKEMIHPMFIIAADRPTQKKIKGLEEATAKGRHPLVRLTNGELRVTELTYQKQKVFLSGDMARHFLVSKIDIVKDDYPIKDRK